MRNVDIPSGAMRASESGLLWEEVISGATGSVEVPKYGTYRVRSAAAAVTVTVDSVLAATLVTGEVLIGNVGIGSPSDSKQTVTLTIAGGNAHVQVARMVNRKAD